MHRRNPLTSITAAWLGLVLVFSIGCSSSQQGAPSPDSTSATAPATAETQSSPGGSDGIALVDFDQTNDPEAAARNELDLVREIRTEAGMPALIGPNGEEAFATLDAIEAEFARTVLADVATFVESGEFPTEPSAGSTRQGNMLAVFGVSAIDINLLADTGFTTSLIMTMLTGVIVNAGTSESGTLPHQQSFDKTADGLRQQGDVGTSITVQAGGGKVSVDIILSATDRISNAATGSFVALYTSRSVGHFDIEACPDAEGIAAGTYTFETKHELTDVSGASTVASGGGRSVAGPFRVIDGEDAHLVQVEAALDLTADARGPGSPEGPGSTTPFDWTAAQHVEIITPRSGDTTWNGGAASVSGTGGDSASGYMFFSTAMAQLFLAEVGKEAEKFWRSGKCIELVPSRDTGKVKPNEQISLVVNARQAFTGDEIKKPITPTFTGKASLEPTEATDAPATFTFVAGPDKDDKGTINLEQTSIRGIGTKTLEFTVEGGGLRVAMTGAWQLTGAGNHFSGEATLDEVILRLQDGDTYVGNGTVSAVGNMSGHGCSGDVRLAQAVQLEGVLVESDPSLVRLTASVEPSEDLVTVECPTGSVSVPFDVGIHLWFQGLRDPLPIGQSTDVSIDETQGGGEGQGNAVVTISEE